MKRISIISAILFFAASSMFAQTELFRVKVTEKQVPEVIVTSVTEDFPEGTVTEYAAIPITIVEDKVYIYENEAGMGEDYDTYVATISGKSGMIQATYDKDGNLVSTVERMKNVVLPRPVQTSIGRHFPGWSVDGDKMVMTSVTGGKQKTHYKVKLKNGKEHHRVVFDADGNIIRGAEKAKKHRQISYRKSWAKKLRKGDDDEYDYDDGDNK